MASYTTKITIMDIVFSYIIGFPIAVTLIIAWMVLKSSGIFVVDMTRYNEFYFETLLFILWTLLLVINIDKLNEFLKVYARLNVH